MFGIHTRRSLLLRSLAALLGWLGLRPTPTPAQTAPGCPHPLHQPLFADRPGSGWWYKTDLRLACPLCHETIHQRGYLPEPTSASCRLSVTPDGPVPEGACAGVTTFTYDATAGQRALTSHDPVTTTPCSCTPPEASA